MAVQANYVNYCPTQLITSRDVNQGNHTNNMYSYYTDSGIPITEAERIIPFDPCMPKVSLQSDSGVTYNVPFSRKRFRDISTDFNALPVSQNSRELPFEHHDSVYQLQQQQQQQQQHNIDFVIAQHTEQVRMQVEEMERRQTKMLIAAMRDILSKKMNEKDEHIKRMVKLNLVLQEKFRSLSVENEWWRNLAMSNEEIANSLRNNLEQVLAQVTIGGNAGGGETVVDDAESSCGNNDYAVHGSGDGFRGKKDMLCKQCKERESTVLLLPCKHLCLCTMCGSLVHICPVCKSFSQSSVHVNMC